MSSQNRTLKNLLLAPHFQLKLLSYFLGLFLISTASFYSTTYLFFWKLKSKALSVGIPDEHVFFKFLSNQKEDMDALFIGLALFNFFLLLGVGFIVSHRIAGPLMKIKEKLHSLGPESEELQLREKDFLQEMAPVVNELKERMKK
jgi:hypothetical protein